VGFEEVYWPGQTSPGNGGDFYVIPKIPSDANDDIVLVAFRFLNNAWVMIGEEKGNAIEAEMGTAYEEGVVDNIPDLTKKGKIFAPSTPAAMVAAGKFRIPPRAWNTTLWVKITGTIGDKLIAVHSPVAKLANDDWGQSDLNGRVEIGRFGLESGYGGGNKQTITTNLSFFPIRGRVDAKNVYQTTVGRAGRLSFSVQAINDGGSFWGTQLVASDAFSVAAIPVQVIMNEQAGGRQGFAFGTKVTGYSFGWGTLYTQEFVSDSGPNRASDLSQVLVKEDVIPKNPNPEGNAAEQLAVAASQTEVYLPVGHPDLAEDNHTAEHGRYPFDNAVNRAKAAAVIRLQINTFGTGSGSGPFESWS